MFSLIHIALAIMHVAIAIITFRLYQRERSIGLAILVVIAIGLFYDNLVVGLGASIGIGDTLEAMSIPRFIIHAVFTPLLLITGYQLSNQAGLAWTENRKTHMVLLLVVGALILGGIAQNFVNSHLLPACHNGTVRYSERITESQLCEAFIYPEGVTEQRGMPPLASISTIVVLLGMGISIWRKTGWKWMFLGALIMFICAAVPASIVGLWVGNTGEVILLASMMVSAYRFSDSKIDTFISVVTA